MRSLFPDKMPAWIKPTIVLMFVISWIPLSMIAMDRATPSSDPRVSIIPDMDKQEKFTAQAANEMFKDGRAMRPQVAGTVAYGKAHQDTWLYRGVRGQQWANDIPIKATAAMMKRGQKQFDIYCSVCHGLSGYGNGMVAVRADALLEGTWTPPANLHDKLVRSRPSGHLFNTITNGIRNMPPYGTQITVEDRWAIVLYVRALQRSQSATLSDVGDPQQRQTLEDKRMGAVQQADLAANLAAEEAAAAQKDAAATPAATTPEPAVHEEGAQ
ncbi:MAG: cytochrome c [bacterium]|nr:cytochrome c [bacterium]